MTSTYAPGTKEPVQITMTQQEFQELFAEQEMVCRHTMPAIVKFCGHLLALRKVISE
ncbi:MAG: hypothetical protein Q7R68_11080 [Nitrospirales bacterium]|nr:hypothetical protein [Nitrospirales bacterium]